LVRQFNPPPYWFYCWNMQGKLPTRNEPVITTFQTLIRDLPLPKIIFNESSYWL
jgi:hypothetical protein